MKMKPFCLKLVKNVIKERENSTEVHKDLMQYLIQLHKNDESNERKSTAAGMSSEALQETLNHINALV